MKIKFESVKKDILSELINKNINKSSLIIVPNESNKIFCLKKIREENIFSFLNVETIKTVKNYSILSNYPFLKENKRIVALYQSLSLETLKLSKCENYFQFISLANNFFDFWEEYSDENLEENNVREIIKSDENNWQEEIFNLMLIMKNEYKIYLDKKKYSDIIFEYNVSKIDDKYLSKFNEIFIANQYYLTKMEKKIFEKHKNIILILQCKENEYDYFNNKIKKVNLSEIINPDIKIDMFIARDSFSMANSMLGKIRDSKPSLLVDFNYDSREYSKFISNEIICQNNKKSIKTTSIFNFLFSLQNIMLDIFYKRKIYFSIGSLINFIQLDTTKRWIKCENYDKILADLFLLNEKSFKYLDFSFVWEEELENSFVLVNFIKELEEKLYNLFQIKEIASFVKLFSKENIFDLDIILSEEEKNYSNLYEKFFEIIEDFSLLDSLNIIDDWEKFYIDDDKYSGISFILKLFINYCKNKEITWFKDLQSGIQVSNLQDTRNLHFEDIVILNCVEGILPGSPNNIFLFSENQRKKLGLKSYDDLKLRFRYYFFRLFSSAKKISLFTIKNLDENIEISSFVEELLIEYPKNVNVINVEDISFYNVYLDFFEGSYIKKDKREIDKTFFYFDNDYIYSDFYLSYSDWVKISENPFTYYLLKKLKINERINLVSTKLTPRDIGKIVHKILENICLRIFSVNKNKNFEIKAVTEDFLYKLILSILDKQYFLLKIPNNFFEVYFKNVIVKMLINSFINFLNFLEKKYSFFDEEYNFFTEESIYKNKSLFSLYNDCNVYFKGRADLVLITKKCNLIFDFKVGKGNIEQLIFYEWMFFLKNNKVINNLYSFLFYVNKSSFESLRKNDSLFSLELHEKLRDKIKLLLNSIIKKGFYVKENSTFFEELSRIDIYNKELFIMEIL